MNKKAIIVLTSLLLILGTIIYFINRWESKQIIKKTNEEDDRGIVKIFFTKRNVIPLAVGVLMSLRLRDLIVTIVDSIVHPIFNLDLDRNGTPDIREMANLLTLNFFGIKYKLGVLLLDIIKFVIFLCVVYVMIILIYTKTNYIRI